jgi:hypothetical protein
VSDSTTPQNSLAELRAVLFETIRGVRAGSTDLDQARSVNALAQTLVDTGRLEVEYARATGSEIEAGFLPAKAEPPGTPGIKGTTVHRLR